MRKTTGALTSSFATEADICDILSAALPRVLVGSTASGTVKSVAQRAVGSVIPDFILLHTPQVIDDAPPNELTIFEASIVAAFLGGRPLREETIATRLYARTKRVNAVLSLLRRRGVVDRQPSGSYILAPNVRLNSLRIVAVEAKLRRWRDALAQAISYQRFANEAYVALPSDVIARRSLLNREARSWGVGLLSVSNTAVEMLVRAKHTAVRTRDFVWIASRLVPVGKRVQHVIRGA